MDEFKKYILKNRKDYVALTKIQDKNLGRLYITAAENIKKDAELIVNKTAWPYSQKLKEVKRLLTEADKLTGGFKSILDKALIDSADLGKEVNEVILNRYSQKLSAKGINVNMKRVLTTVTDDAVKVIYSRIWEDGLKLSDRIWILNRRTKREIERIVLEEIVSGRPASSKILEARLNKLLNPSRRGVMTKLHGRRVSYDAARLLRTERATAFREADRIASLKNPGLIGIEWHTSGDACQVCSDLVGVYEPKDLPTTPHPNCNCYTADAAISSKQFADNYIEFIKNPSSQPQIADWYKMYGKAA